MTNGRSEPVFRTYIIIDQWGMATEMQKEKPCDFHVITLLKLIFYLWDSLWVIKDLLFLGIKALAIKKFQP